MVFIIALMMGLPVFILQLPGHQQQLFNGNELKQIIARENVHIRQWHSYIRLFSKAVPGFTLQFTGNNSGSITQVLAFGSDIWKKVN